MKIQKIYNGNSGQKKGFWRSFFRIFTIEFASLSILEVLVILAIVGGGIYYTKNASQKSYEQMLTGKITGFSKCQQDLQKQSEQNAYDKVRISDTTNILLALQDYSFDKANMPSDLATLKSGGYFSGNLNDPELGKPYYYKKLSPIDYVLCVYLSTGVWGTNISQCPTKDEFLAPPKETSSATAPAPTPAPAPVKEAKKISIAETPNGWLNVRKDPNTTSEVLIKVNLGETYEVLEEQADWIKIKLSSPVKLSDGIFDSGWVWKAYTK